MASRVAKTPARARTKTGAARAYRRDNLQEPETQRKRQASANRCLGLLKAALNLAWREKKVVRWTFFEIQSDSFRWMAERAPDEKNWRKEVDIWARRAAATAAPATLPTAAPVP